MMEVALAVALGPVQIGGVGERALNWRLHVAELQLERKGRRTPKLPQQGS